MTDATRQIILDKITTLSSHHLCTDLQYDLARREAFYEGGGKLVQGGKGRKSFRAYLSEHPEDVFDASDWNAMVEWENANTLLAIYDLEGPDAATLWKLSNP